MTIIGLTKSDVSPQGPTHSSAHHVIKMIKGSPEQGGKVIVVVESFATKADYDAGKTKFCERVYSFTMSYTGGDSSKNLYDFLYAALKADAVQNSGFYNSGTSDVTDA